jgi:hypothetical protein
VGEGSKYAAQMWADMAHYSQLTYGFFGALFGTPRRNAEERQVEEDTIRLTG